MQRLRRRQDFVRLRDGRKAHAATLILQADARADGESEPRAGFTVTRKIGSAVVRNRIRRRLREAMRRAAALHARPGVDYVVIGRRLALNAPFDAILNDLEAAFGRVHAGRRERRPGGAGRAADEALR